MNSLNFNQVGGFPLTTRILDEIQKAYSVFNALGAIAGDKTIISGCVTTGSIVSDGVVFINGEVLEFRAAALQTKVKIIEVVETLVFEDNVAKSVIKTRYVTFGTGVGAMDWVDFKRGFETKNIETVFDSMSQSLATIATKLATIEQGAKVQLQSDFNQTDSTKKDYIKNIPGFINYLHKGTFAVGDVFDDDLLKITFPTVGTDQYLVVGSLLSIGSNYDNDNDVIWMIRDKQSTSFKITLREINGGNVQNLSFEYMLIPL